MTLIKSISGIRGTIGGAPGEGLSPLDIVKFTYAYCEKMKSRLPKQDGERYKVCEDCGETIVEKIPALTGGFSGDCNSSLDLGTVGLLLSAVATAVVLKKRK